MNLLLVIVAVVSAAAALVLGWLFVRLRNEDRRRSDARVIALAGAIDAPDGARPAAPVEWMPESAPSLFGSERAERSGGMPVIRVAVAAAMSVTLLVAIAMSNRGSSAAGPEGAPRTVAARASAPLELISMRHERTGGELRVSGLVRNPRTAGTLTRVSAVVFAFNRTGAFIASGRAGVDFTTLEPGDESPFVVVVPGAADVGRYRVSFRTDAGVVQHVDRRADQMRAAAALE